MAIEIVLVAAFVILVLGSASVWIALNWSKLAEKRLTKWTGATFLLISLTIAAVVIGVFLPESIVGMVILGTMLLGYAIFHKPEKKKRDENSIRFVDGEVAEIVEDDPPKRKRV